MNICMVTGGTGGHIYPALALADLWRNLSAEQMDRLNLEEDHPEIFFIGNDDRMEKDIIPKAGYEFIGLHTKGLSKNPLKLTRALSLFGTAYKKALKILKNKKCDLVIGFGGYVSAPVLLAASHLNIPTLIHEQNSVAGKSNKLVANRVDGIVTCYEKAVEAFDPGKTFLLGNPRGTLVVQNEGDLEYFRSLGLDPDKKTVMVMMGSLGSSSINELMKEALRNVKDLQILYVCGKDTSLKADTFKGLPVVVQPYVDTMRIYPYLYGLICRAGATTIAEITALGKPAVLIPSPYVAYNHQYFNALQLTQKNAAVMIEEKNLNASTLSEAIDQVFKDEKTYEQMSMAARSIGYPEAGYDIIKLACQILKQAKS